jgi:predicted enzyme related to lactoylglutathione lyase/transcriptional regulator with XRE-family HTH domain
LLSRPLSGSIRAGVLFRHYLQAELASRCARNPRYSLRAFARHLGIDGSTLSQILRGRRVLSPAMIRRLSTKLGLADAQLETFLAAEPDRQKQAARQLAALDAVRVLSEPHHLALLELVRLPDFRPDVRWISRVLGIPADTVNVAVARLLRLGLLRMTGTGWQDRTEGADLSQLARRVAEQVAQAEPPPVDASPAQVPKEQTVGQPVMQWQLLAKDAERASRFYAGVFGWNVRTDNAMGYRTVETGAGRGIDGGIWPTPPEGRATVQLFVEVEDFEACLERARELGGSVMMPPQKLPDGDEMALIIDSEGLTVGLFRPRGAPHAKR